jgi:hypothetical protein
VNVIKSILIVIVHSHLATGWFSLFCMLFGALQFGPRPVVSLFVAVLLVVATSGFPYSNWNVPDNSNDHYQLAIFGPRTLRYQEFAQYMVMSAQSSRVVGFVREDMLHSACGSLPAQAVETLKASHGVLFWIDSVDIPAEADGILGYVESLCACVGISNRSHLMYAILVS